MPTKPPKPPTPAELARAKASEERGKRNEASGKASHQERVAARNEETSKKNAARAAAHPAPVKRAGDAQFRRTGTGSVADRLGKKDTVQADRNKIVAAAQDAYVKEHPAESAAARMGKNHLVNGDRLAAYNRTPVNNGNINASKPGSRQYRRAPKGSDGGGRFA
jgi:hypothetical protein